MPELADGDSVEVQGSGSNRYTLKNVGGVFSCTCPAWLNQSVAIEARTCKHLKDYLGEAEELERVRARGGAEAAEAAGRKSTKKKGPAEPPLLLAHPFDPVVDPSGWWMSEKLDGVRAYWDGFRFFSRLGNEFHAPDWFFEGLPDEPLDGELWGGRKTFQKTAGLVKRQDKGEYWRKITYVVFDAPGMDAPFEQRLAFVKDTLGKKKPPFAKVHEHELCRDGEHLRQELARVEQLGGEGLMLRKPGSKYQVGRSSTLLKVKTFRDDEARVVGHEKGAGKHTGKLGALLVETKDGVRFSVGTGLSDAERKSPPPIGAIITFRYQELSEAGVPRFPSYVGVRHDVKWPEPAKKAKTKKVVESAPAATSPPATPSPSSATRRFELSDGKSNKFWEISVDGSTYTVRFGRIGTAGQAKPKAFTSADEARRAADKVIAEKTGEGYREVSSGEVSPS